MGDVRRVNAWTYQEEDSGGADDAGYWEEWNDEWEGGPTHMLVPVETWEEVVGALRKINKYEPKKYKHGEQGHYCAYRSAIDGVRDLARAALAEIGGEDE
jgi:hypothetical protein